MFARTKRCYVCNGLLKRNNVLHHINIYNEIPLKLFCSKECKQKYLDSIKPKKRFTNLLEWFKAH